MLDYKFLFNYLQHKRSYAILSSTSSRNMLKMSTIGRNARVESDVCESR